MSELICANAIVDEELNDVSTEQEEAGRDGDRAVEPTVASEARATPDEAAPVDDVPDPFDPARLRLSQDFAATLGVQRVLLTVPVRKPSKEWWVQVHPDERYRIQTAVLELKEDREIYLVDRGLWSELANESTFGSRALFTAMNRQGTLFLWPIRLPGNDGKIDNWSRSAHEAASLAVGQWVRVAANMDLGAYDVLTSTADLPPPSWPETSFREMLEVAFKDRYIRSPDHIVLRRLRGEA